VVCFDDARDAAIGMQRQVRVGLAAHAAPWTRGKPMTQAVLEKIW